MTTVKDTNNGSAYTFTSMSIGSGDYVVVCVVGNLGSAAGASSVSVGANSATKVSGVAGGSLGNYRVAEIWIASHPGGTNADVSVNFPASATACEVATYAVSKIRSTTPTDTATDTGSANLSLDCNVQGGGIIIGVAMYRTTVIFTDGSSWSGLTKDDGDTLEATSEITFASDAFADPATPQTITASMTGSSSCGASASFR